MAWSTLGRAWPLCVLMAACTPATPPPSEEAPADPDPLAWSVSVDADACLEGECARYELRLDARGQVLWFGRTHVDGLGATTSAVSPEVAETIWSELSQWRRTVGEPEGDVHRVCGGGDLDYRYRVQVFEPGATSTFEVQVEPGMCEPGPWLSLMRRMELMAGRYRLDGERLYCWRPAGKGGPTYDPECLDGPDRSAWWLHRR